MESYIRTFVKNDAQKYIDKPIYAKPKEDRSSSIAIIISKLFHNGSDRTPKPMLVAYERIALRWMDRDKKGEMKPKYQNRENK